jgi:flotillin
VEAEALRRATAAEKIAQAKALEESYLAEQAAETARANREKATLEADVLVKTEIEKLKRQLEAEAVAEEIRRKAKGEADGIFSKMEAEARGTLEVLSKQAEGFNLIVKAAGSNPDAAVKMLIADKLEQLVRIQVEAIKNMKIDKVTVWDGGSNKDGSSATSNFISSLVKSIPPMNELFKMAGLELPKYLGEETKPEADNKSEPESVK